MSFNCPTLIGFGKVMEGHDSVATSFTQDLLENSMHCQRDFRSER